MKGGYLNRIPYPVRFHREHAPLWLSCVATALGYPAPPVKGARFCEIGCGSGFGLCVLAAANPDTLFHGFDIDAAEIERAQARARSAGLSNVVFRQADVRELAASSTASYDFIVSHGAYSWVAEDVRASIRCFVAKSLSDRGIAYLHYMSHPGASAFAFFHAVFRHAAAKCGGDVERAIADGLAVLQDMRKAKAGFFILHPHAESTLDHLAREDPLYIAHDFLNSVFHAMHSGDVIRDMEEAGLSFVGSATPIENIDTISVPGSMLALVYAQRDLAVRELFKDAACNQSLRRDLFVRKPRPLDAAGHLEALRAIVFCLLPGAPKSGGLVFDTRIGRVNGAAEIFSPLLERLAAGPARFSELETLRPFVRQPGLLNQSLQALLWAGVAHPTLPSFDANAVERLNIILVDAARHGESVPAIAAPQIGSGLPLRGDVIQQM